MDFHFVVTHKDMHATLFLIHQMTLIFITAIDNFGLEIALMRLDYIT